MHMLTPMDKLCFLYIHTCWPIDYQIFLFNENKKLLEPQNLQSPGLWTSP